MTEGNEGMTLEEVLRAIAEEVGQPDMEPVVTIPGEWIATSERLPEMREVVLLAVRNAKRAKEGYLLEDNGWRVWGGIYPSLDAVTHWMPLPDLPVD